jgi:nucleoside-diphosphate-sugar epimerase
MKVLIIGTDGFIGRHLKDFFLSTGHEVIGTVFNDPAEGDDYCIDIRSAASIEALPDIPFDAVINAAGIVDQSAPSSLMMDVNARGAANLARWARRRGCPHFIQLSSIAVYGLKTLGVNRSEDRTRRFRGVLGIAYMRSKARAETLIERSGAPYTMLRLPAVIGRGDSFTSPSIVRWLRSGNFFFCGPGTRPVSLLFAKNLGPWVEALIAKGPLNCAFNCADHHVPWRDLVGHFAGLLNLPVPERTRSILALPLHLRDAGAHMLFTFSLFGSHFPSERLMRATAFTPPHDWRQGVAESLDGLAG